MTLGELLRVLPNTQHIEVRVLKGENEITIARGVTMEVDEVTPTDRNKLKVVVK